MTFKHTKFEDSAIMRSFEKLSLEKGLVKNDLLKKIASRKPKLDLSPGDNLVENLLKLCAGLREDGFEKYANELESAFMLYKQAEASECDNDILEQAHPKGSHKLDGVSGDAVVETIVDQHLTNMKIVNKMPTGKLTTASEIINAVRKLTKNAQELELNDIQLIDWRKKTANNKIHQIEHIINLIKSKNNTYLKVTTTLYSRVAHNVNHLSTILDSINEDSIDSENLNNIDEDFNDILHSLSVLERFKTQITSPLSAVDTVYSNFGDIIDYSKLSSTDWKNLGIIKDQIENEARKGLMISEETKNILSGGRDSEVQKHYQASQSEAKLFFDTLTAIKQEFISFQAKFVTKPNTLAWLTKQINELDALFGSARENANYTSLLKTLKVKEDLLKKFKTTNNL